MTHCGRALEALNIEIICANSPQAKGRVERANGTLQDRLVKAMRLDGISSIAEANTFLDSYMARHNARFARPAFDARDLHRPLAPHDDLRSIMVWREQRRSEEHTSELQSLMRISYAVFRLKKKKDKTQQE